MQAKPCDHRPSYVGCGCDYPTQATYRISSGGIDPAEHFERWMPMFRETIVAFSEPTTFARGLWTLWPGGKWPGLMPYQLVT